MDHEWIVEVRDNTGAPVTDASVALFERTSTTAWPFDSIPKTHVHKGGGTYEASPPIAPTHAMWMLAVLVKGNSPVTQPVRMKPGRAGETLTVPAPRTASTVAFSSEVKVVAGAKVRRTRFRVTVFPSSEIVFLSGTDYEG